MTSFVAALAGKHFELAQLLHWRIIATAQRSSVDPRGREGFTPLIFAASYGDLEMIQVLLEYKADINAQRDYGTTPLRETVSYGGHEAARSLLENCEDPNIPMYDGEAPLRRASKTGDSGHQEKPPVLARDYYR